MDSQRLIRCLCRYDPPERGYGLKSVVDPGFNDEPSFSHKFEPATNPGAPVLLLLHGAGGDENSLISIGKAIAPGAALLSPRGKVIEHGMPRFFQRLPDGSFDQEDLAFRTQELRQFVEDAFSRHPVPKTPMILAGFSNGATIAASLLLVFPQAFAGAILLRGMAPFFPNKLFPNKPLDLLRKPVLLLNGAEDPIVQADEVEELANMLRSANAEITLHWEKAGHTLVQGDILMAFDWVRRFYRVRPTLPQ